MSYHLRDIGALQLSSHLYTLSFILLITITIYLLSVRYRKGLREVPGPWIASVTGLWKVYIIWKSKMPWTSIKLHEKYGPIVRIGPKHVSVGDPEAIKIIYGSDDRFRKSMFFRVAQGSYGGQILANFFATDDPDYHAKLKRVAGNAYSTTSIAELEPQLDSCVDLFISQLKKSSQLKNSSIDMGAWVQYYTFDCLGEVSHSKKVGCLASGTDVGGMLGAVDEIFDYVSLVGQMPFLDKILLGNGFLQRLWKKSGNSYGILDYAIDAVNNYKCIHDKPRDILGRMLEIQHRDPSKLSRRDIVGTVAINVFAGHDALAIGLRTMLYNLCRDERVYDKLMEEILEADAAGDLSEPVSYKEAVALPYLSAIITETFRIHPPVGLILERYVPPGGATICGVHLPEDTVVGISAWVLHHDKRLFGEDASQFVPERWLETSIEHQREMHRNLFSFGAGSRACIGKSVAMFEIYKLTTELCRNFDFRLAHPTKEWEVQGRWVTKQTGLEMIFTARDGL